MCFRTHEGATTFVPLSWTSLYTPDPLVVMADGRADFRADDLATLAAMIAQRLGREAQP